ncbi:hypothetical protein IP87_16930 [beta proteobacterium AAP121]|nr:hypothetical protein IP80_13840 [beta proteobacterium AAP65]KPF95380.1 hypothetical protein IP87_16930 [beta proteobacterium AAP121]
MKTNDFLRAAVAALALGPLAALSSGAAVVQTLGIGSAVTAVQFSADFSANTTLASPYSEGGLVFSHTGFADDNGGCGYAGEFCVDLGAGEKYSEAFDGNYFATAGQNAYLRISSGDTALTAIEFAADSGYASIHLLWETWLGGTRTGQGKVSLGASGVGGVVGLRDTAGFNEVRVYAFDSASDNSGYSAAAIDSVRGFAVPLPGTLALALGGLGLVAGLRRRESSAA